MGIPIILLFGNAGAGKDHTANVIENYCKEKYSHIKVQKIALADPMKALCAQIFEGVSEESLWGPSELRKGIISKFPYRDFSIETAAEIVHYKMYSMGITKTDHCPTEYGVILNWLELIDEKIKKGELTIRFALQTLGTELGRKLDTNLWVSLGIKNAKELLTTQSEYNRMTGVTQKNGAKTDLVLVTDGRFRNEAIEFKQCGATVWRILGDENLIVPNHASESEQKGIPNFWFDEIVDNNSEMWSYLEPRVQSLISNYLEI